MARRRFVDLVQHDDTPDPGLAASERTGRPALGIAPVARTTQLYRLITGWSTTERLRSSRPSLRPPHRAGTAESRQARSRISRSVKATSASATFGPDMRPSGTECMQVQSPIQCPSPRAELPNTRGLASGSGPSPKVSVVSRLGRDAEHGEADLVERDRLAAAVELANDRAVGEDVGAGRDLDRLEEALLGHEDREPRLEQLADCGDHLIDDDRREPDG